jgi:large subunit ribosomal protein L18
VQFRRRRQNKTDYLARKKLLESESTRLVIRKTNRYILTQIVESKEAQDKVLCSINSKDLIKFGWPESYSIKNLEAAYLTGYLCALKAIKQNIKKAILDIGLQRSIKGSKIYAVVNGAVDAGLNISCSKEMFPDKKRMKINTQILEKIKHG